MQLIYKSDFPNQVHQLNIFISQHYYLLKDGTIKWQKTPFNVKWDNYKESRKQHLVSFIIRDHFSNCFYAELHSIEQMPAIHEFLFNAWRKKEYYEFWGGPQCLIVPKATQSQFPTILNFFRNTEKVNLKTPSSGFTTAMAAIRTWEKHIRYFTHFYEDCRTITDFQANIEAINNTINTYPGKDKSASNLAKWSKNQPKILSPGDKGRFYGFFDPTPQKLHPFQNENQQLSDHAQEIHTPKT